MGKGTFRVLLEIVALFQDQSSVKTLDCFVREFREMLRFSEDPRRFNNPSGLLR